MMVKATPKKPAPAPKVKTQPEKKAAEKKAPAAKAEPTEDAPKRKPGRPAKGPIPYGGPAFGLEDATVEMIPIKKLVLDDTTFQFRVTVRTRELEDSIRTHGILVPTTVRPHPAHKGKYQVICGFSRSIAAVNVGKTEVPGIIRKLTDEEAYIHAYAENEVRKSFRDLDRAVAISKVRKEQDKTTEEIGHLFRLSERHVQRLEGLLSYEDELKAAMDDGKLETTHAMVLHQAKRKAAAIDLSEWIARVQEAPLSVEQLKTALKTDYPNKRESVRLFRQKKLEYTFNLKKLESATADDKKKAVAALRELLEKLEGK